MALETRPAPHAGWRALAATVLVMSGAVLAHTVAGGRAPDAPSVVALGGLVLLASLLALHQVVPDRWLLAGLALAQLGLHTTMAAPSGAHAAHADVAVHSPWSWQMLVAHAAVTLATAAVWRLCARAAVVVVGLVDLFHAPAAPRRALRHPVLASAGATPHVLLLAVAPRRGPPASRLA